MESQHKPEKTELSCETFQNNPAVNWKKYFNKHPLNPISKSLNKCEK